MRVSFFASRSTFFFCKDIFTNRFVGQKFLVVKKVGKFRGGGRHPPAPPLVRMLISLAVKYFPFMDGLICSAINRVSLSVCRTCPHELQNLPVGEGITRFLCGGTVYFFLRYKKRYLFFACTSRYAAPIRHQRLPSCFWFAPTTIMWSDVPFLPLPLRKNTLNLKGAYGCTASDPFGVDDCDVSALDGGSSLTWGDP